MATITSRILPLREWNKIGADDEVYAPQWHRTAPKLVARAERWSGGSDGWTAWASHLGRRRSPRPVAELFVGNAPSLLWALPALPAPSFSGALPAHELLASLDRLERRGRKWKHAADPVELAGRWSTDAAHRQGEAFGLECVAWCRALPALASLLPASLWWRMFALLLSVAEDPHGLTEADALSVAWIAAELPLTLAYLFPEVAPARQLGRGGAKAALSALSACVAEDGMPLAHNLPITRPLMATLARSRTLARRLKKPCWGNSAESRYTSFASQVLRLLRRDGTLSLTPEQPTAAEEGLFAAVFDGTARRTRTAASQMVRGLALPARVPADRLPKAAANSEKAGVSVLRPGWAPSGERLSVSRRGTDLTIELAAGRDVLLSGAWSCHVERDGVPLTPAPEARWEETCWISHKDVDYLELELQLAEGVCIERQILMARRDRFLYIADAVLADRPGNLSYQGVLPLLDNIAFDASTESREGYLVGRKARGLLFPLSLPEWRAQPCGGSVEMTEQGFQVRATRSNARALYTPLLIDLSPRRLFEPATWRQLTVAESLAVVPPDLAVGYRLQVRDRQWLVYRSLGPRGNRTVLGQNLVSEFLVARFLTNGETEPLVEIE